MAQPFDYMLNIPNPTENLMGSIQLAQGISQFRNQRTQAEAQAARQEQLQSDLAKLSENPSPAMLSQVMIKYPEMSEQFKRTYDVLSSEQQTARVNQASQVYAALEAGKPEMAQQILQEQALAYKNSGSDKDAKVLEDLSEMVRVSPETARTSAGLFLASAMGPEKFAETFTKLQGERREAELAPSKLTESQSKAQKAAIDARFAESNAALDLQKKGWDIQKIQNDISVSRQNSKIAAMNAQLSREQNDLKRAELQQKINDAQDKRDATVRDKTAALESARGNIDNMLNTADRILATPLVDVERATGPAAQKIFTLREGTSNFEELINNIEAQAFLSQIPNMVGMGALSDAEGKKLGSALQNFSLRQSADRLLDNVKEAQRLMLKARKNIADKHGVPETIPDTPAAAGSSPADIDALIQQYAPGG